MRPDLRSAALALLAASLTTAWTASGQAAYKGHGRESVAPEVLAQYAPKPLPPELAARIQTLMDLRAPVLGLPSPDGARLFFAWSVTGTPQVWRLDGPDRFPVQLTGGQDRTSVAGLSADGRTLFVQRDRQGEESEAGGGEERGEAHGGSDLRQGFVSRVRFGL